MNERLLRDGCEAVALLRGLAGEPSSRAVRLWLEFSTSPTGRNWYRAHNASIVGGYLEHRNLAEADYGRGWNRDERTAAIGPVPRPHHGRASGARSAARMVAPHAFRMGPAASRDA
jgi:hypothetical protein